MMEIIVKIQVESQQRLKIIGQLVAALHGVIESVSAGPDMIVSAGPGVIQSVPGLV